MQAGRPQVFEQDAVDRVGPVDGGGHEPGEAGDHPRGVEVRPHVAPRQQAQRHHQVRVEWAGRGGDGGRRRERHGGRRAGGRPGPARPGVGTGLRGSAAAAAAAAGRAAAGLAGRGVRAATGMACPVEGGGG